VKLNASPRRMPNSITFSFNTGSAPGMPKHTGHVCELGASPNFRKHRQKSFVWV